MSQTKSQNSPEVVVATSRKVGCDGGAGNSQGSLGHPLVYLTIPAGADSVDCPYCDRHFVLSADAASDHH